MRIRSLLAAASALALLSGCSGPPPSPPAPPAITSAPSPAQLREEGDARARRGEHARAAESYRAALRLAPDDLFLHFALGSVLSYTDRRDETVEQFSWVVAHGRPGQPEVATARAWLAAAQPPPKAAASRTEPQPAPAPGPLGAVKGATSWPGVDPESQWVPLELRIAGAAPETAHMKMRIRLFLGRPYTFLSLPAGPYRILARSGGTKLWETRVVVDAGKETVLDLSEANSLVKAADFPPKQG